MSPVRDLFYETCRKFKGIYQKQVPWFECSYSQNQAFRTGVVKILERHENDIALCEKNAHARLRNIEVQQEPEEQCDNGDDFASDVLKKEARVTTASE